MEGMELNAREAYELYKEIFLAYDSHAYDIARELAAQLLAHLDADGAWPTGDNLPRRALARAEMAVIINGRCPARLDM